MEEKTSMEELKEIIKKNLEKFTEDDINEENIENLYKLVDIYKDLENVEYWKKEEEDMRYYGDNEYSRDFSGEYGRQGMRGTGSYSRYRGGRGLGRYRSDYGDEMLEDMHESYGAYREGREQYNRGNYGAEQDTMKSLDYMLKSVKQFMNMLSKDAGSEEEMRMIKRTAQEIGDM
jgi:hypothetical protein